MKLNKNLKPGKVINALRKIKKDKPSAPNKLYINTLTQNIMDRISTIQKIEQTTQQKKKEPFLLKRFFNQPVLALGSAFSIILLLLFLIRPGESGLEKNILHSSNFLSKDFCLVMENMKELENYKTIADMEILIESIE